MIKLNITIICALQAVALSLCMVPASANRSTIVPGGAVGPLRLGALDATMDKLGYREEGDTAMGRTWTPLILHHSKQMLLVYTIRDETGLITTIRQIEVASPNFKTPQGVHTGDSLRKVLRFFHNAILA
jgi:hypothetical protein